MPTGPTTAHAAMAAASAISDAITHAAVTIRQAASQPPSVTPDGALGAKTAMDAAAVGAGATMSGAWIGFLGALLGSLLGAAAAGFSAYFGVTKANALERENLRLSTDAEQRVAAHMMLFKLRQQRTKISHLNDDMKAFDEEHVQHLKAFAVPSIATVRVDPIDFGSLGFLLVTPEGRGILDGVYHAQKELMVSMEMLNKRSAIFAEHFFPKMDDRVRDSREAAGYYKDHFGEGHLFALQATSFQAVKIIQRTFEEYTALMPVVEAFLTSRFGPEFLTVIGTGSITESPDRIDG